MPRNSDVDLIFADGDAHLLTSPDRTLVLQQRVWEDLRVALTSTKLGGTKDPGFAVFATNGAGSQGVFTYLFDAATEEELYFAAQLPHNQALDTHIVPHIHWSPVSNGSAGQTVCWGLEYCWAEIGVAFGNTAIIYGTAHVPADSALVAGKHYITSFGAIRGHAKSVSNVLICRLFRDATGSGGTDSYAADAAALYFDFHYQIDTIGSRTELAK